MKSYHADGLERVEMYLHSLSWPLVPQAQRGKRIPVGVVTKNGEFEGGIRKDKSGRVYLCCDLLSLPDNLKVSLAKLLRECGVRPKQTITVEVVDEKWIIP